jgi:hypothetical protein
MTEIKKAAHKGYFLETSKISLLLSGQSSITVGNPVNSVTIIIRY